MQELKPKYEKYLLSWLKWYAKLPCRCAFGKCKKCTHPGSPKNLINNHQAWKK